MRRCDIAEFTIDQLVWDDGLHTKVKSDKMKAFGGAQ